MEPLLKWVGGKRWQLPLLKRVWAKHRERRLVEPFCGALSVTLGLEPDRALLNDVNPHLINFYRQLQRGLSFDLDLSPGDYYANRDWFNALIREGLRDTPAAANLFYYLNHFGFNGLCRFNTKGEFNVPAGHKSGDGFWRTRKVNAIPTDLARITLARHEFTCARWQDVTYGDDDLVYADPPYDDGFTNYTGTEFSFGQQQELALTLSLRKGPTVLCNLATPRILELYQHHGLHCLLIDAPRRVAANGDRAPVKEVIASNFRIEKHLLNGLEYKATFIEETT